MDKVKIVRVATVPLFFVTQLKQQVMDLVDEGFDVSIVASDGDLREEVESWPGVTFHAINIERKISLWKDVVALIQLYRLFRAVGFDIAHSTTPKAGLLCAVAAFLTRVKVRLHTYTGQPWVTETGVKRRVLRGCDQMIGAVNTRCYADSNSQAQFLIDEKIISSHKISTLGEGSLAGVNLSRFDMNRTDICKSSLRAEMGLSDDSVVLLFVGRLVEDKGVLELLKAFTILISEGYDLQLLLVGPLEEGCELLEPYLSMSISNRIHEIGYVETPEFYMGVSDLLCLPSYREGFGTVIIEAAAMGVPSVGSNIYGLSDAIQDSKTGILVEPKSVSALVKGIKSLLDSPGTVVEMGICSRERARTKFGSKTISRLVAEEYRNLLGD